MLDIGWPELMLVMVVALVVIGPKELPGTIRTVVGVVRKMRGMANEFKSGLADIADEVGAEDIKKSIVDDITYDPKEALESIGEIDGGEFSLDDDGAPKAGNSILDPATQSKAFTDDPEAAAPDTGKPANSDAVSSTDKDEPTPRPATPVTGNT